MRGPRNSLPPSPRHRCLATSSAKRVISCLGLDAEVALAQALSRQASEAADVRVADAALGAARARLERAARDLARVAAEAAALGDTAPLLAERRRAEDARAQALRHAESAR